MSSQKSILTRIKKQIPPSHYHKAVQILDKIELGDTFSSMGGVRLNQNTSLVRFRLGRNWRLILRASKDGLLFVDIVSRQNFELAIKRR